MGSEFNSSKDNAHAGLPELAVFKQRLNSGETEVSRAVALAVRAFGSYFHVIVEHVAGETKKFEELKLKWQECVKMIDDLTDRCQGMQQALLYKEEKYDEKCREVERYKVICELSAKAAVSDGPYYTSHDQNNNHSSEGKLMRKGGLVKLESQSIEKSKSIGHEVERSKREHVKQDYDQMHKNRMASPARSNCPSYPVRNSSIYGGGDDDDRRSLIASHYAGGPIRRQYTQSNNFSNMQQDARLKDRLETIGAVNVRASHRRSGSVHGSSEVYRSVTMDPYFQDQNRRVRISSVGQANEILSSSGDGAHPSKLRVPEADHYKHSSGGAWTKMSSRRKKEWPF